MRTLLALGVVTFGLAAAGSAMASDDRDGGRDDGRRVERAAGGDHDSKKAGRHSERDQKDAGARHELDDDAKNANHERDQKGEKRDGRRS